MQTLERFDVVCLQEMFSSGSSRMSKLLVQAKKAGFDFYCCSPTKSMLNSAVDGGLVILSRFPIVKTEKTTFKKGVMGISALLLSFPFPFLLFFPFAGARLLFLFLFLIFFFLFFLFSCHRSFFVQFCDEINPRCTY
ncbi:hypothetical protein BC829DRAFT_399246 [Chytridium lagenaria]|nr:hypothetical protein BC829DRAFT_399246 [Chytridium lagenaria]